MSNGPRKRHRPCLRTSAERALKRRTIEMRSLNRYALGAVLLSLAASGSDAGAQSVPMPTPRPKIVHPFIAAPAVPGRAGSVRADGRRLAAVTGATTAAPAPPAPVPAGKSAGTMRPSGTTAFDTSQRALIDRVNAYLGSLNTLVGNFVQVGPDGSRTEGKFYLQK